MTTPAERASAGDAVPLHRAQSAVTQTRYGPAPDVLHLRNDVAVLSPAAQQVQIEVRAASINPIDWQMIEGNRRMIAKRAFPFIPLFDIAGVVSAIGAGVERFRIGDRVHCDNKLEAGGASQFVNVDEALVSAIPGALGFAEAAAIPLAGQTALLCLDRAAVGQHSSLCVIGASGGVGSLVVQMAKAAGVARVIAVCGEHNAAFVRAIGADEVVDYKSHTIDSALAPGSLDAVIDCVGGRSQWLSAKRVLRDGGRFVTIARDEDGVVTAGAILRLLPPILWRQFASRFGRRIQYLMVMLDAHHSLLDRVDALIADGAVKPHVAQVYDFSQDGVVNALAASKAGRVVGKLVVRVSGPAE